MEPEVIKKFINDKDRDTDSFLCDLRKFADDNKIPIVSPEVAKFLSLILDLKRPNRILELGCAIGYSSILMSKFLNENGLIFSIEISDKMIELANKNFAVANVKKHIKLIRGDIKKVLFELVDANEKFDVIFMDGAKGQYVKILPFCLDLLNKDGLIIADDIFQEGRILKKRLEVPRRQRTIHTRMNDFLKNIFENNMLESKIFGIGDGIVVCKKLKEKKTDSLYIPFLLT